MSCDCSSAFHPNVSPRSPSYGTSSQKACLTECNGLSAYPEVADLVFQARSWTTHSQHLRNSQRSARTLAAERVSNYASEAHSCHQTKNVFMLQMSFHVRYQILSSTYKPGGGYIEPSGSGVCGPMDLPYCMALTSLRSRRSGKSSP